MALPPNASQFTQAEIDAFVYKEPFKNKYGGRTGYVNCDSGVGRIRFQTTSDESLELMCRAPFGISTPLEDSKNTMRRNLELSIRDPGLRRFLDSLDERTLAEALCHADDKNWFTKSPSPDVIRAKYRKIVADEARPKDEKTGKEDPNADPYDRTFRTKVNLEGQNVTNFFVMQPNGTMEPLEPATLALERLGKFSHVLVICEVGGLWFTSAEFGLTINATDVLIYPVQERPKPGGFNITGGAAIGSALNALAQQDAERAEDMRPTEEAAAYHHGRTFAETPWGAPEASSAASVADVPMESN